MQYQRKNCLTKAVMVAKNHKPSNWNRKRGFRVVPSNYTGPQNHKQQTLPGTDLIGKSKAVNY